MISVIIPFYNDHQAIQKCLAALAAQTLPLDRFEVIVVDNGSSPPLNESITPPPFACFIQEPRTGSYAARNTGVKNSRGDILIFTDADCIPTPNWLSTAAQFFQDHTDIDAIGGVVQLTPSAQRSVAEDLELCFAFRQEETISTGGYSVTANLAVRKAAFESTGPFNEQLYSGGDREWGLRANHNGLRMQYVPELIVCHPTRATISSLLSKHRRISGGQIQESRAKDSMLIYVFKALIPSIPVRRTFNLLFQHRKYGISFFRSGQIVALLALITLCSLFEKWRLLLGGNPQRK